MLIQTKDFKLSKTFKNCLASISFCYRYTVKEFSTDRMAWIWRTGVFVLTHRQTMTTADGHDWSLYSMCMDLENWQFLCQQYTYMALYAALVMHKAHRVLYIMARDHSSYLQKLRLKLQRKVGEKNRELHLHVSYWPRQVNMSAGSRKQN